MRITYKTLSVIFFGLILSACAPYPIDPVPVSGTVIIKSKPIVHHYPRKIIRPHRIQPRRVYPVRPMRPRPARACYSRGIKPRYCYKRR